MEHQSVVSSNIRSVGYDSRTSAMEVTFKSGSTYSYAGVPAAVHAQLLSAFSVGSFFQANIRDRYPTQRIS